MTGGCIYTHGGEKYWLVYTADAYFEINEKFGADFTDKLRADNRMAYDTAVGCLSILAREGELARRYMGYEQKPMLTEETIRRTTLPKDIIEVKSSVLDCIIAGLRMEGNGDNSEPVDVGLLEYEKKTLPY